MTLDELEQALRTERLDDTVEPFLYASETVRAAFNDAVRQAAIRMRLLVDHSSAECCQYAVAAATTGQVGAVAVILHPRVLALRSVRWSGSDRPLTLTTLKVMDREQPEWPSKEAGTPTHVIVDAQTGAVLLWPRPSEAGTLQASVWRTPLDVEELEIGDDEPAIPEAHHRDLIDWAEHLLYLTKDGEEGDSRRAADAASRFEAKFGRLPSAFEISRWGLNKRSGQTAQFI